VTEEPAGARWRRRTVGALVATVCVATVVWLAARPLTLWWKERSLPRGKKPTILLITLDALRPDHLGCYGSTSVPTPNLDALAKEGVLFESAYAQAPLCLPSHATILTGRVPLRHGLRDDLGFRLKADVPTLAEQFRRAGYRSAAFVSSSTLDRGFGLDRGFDSYQDDLGPSGKTPTRRERTNASETVFRVLSWLASAGSQPLFLWAHLNDAEAPEPAPEPFAHAYRDRPYDGRIAFLDKELARLVSEVRRTRPRTVVAVVADHGESLGEHGEPRHGYFVYSATTRVPLLLAGGVPRGLRIPALVRTMDLMPTLLDLAGLPRPQGLDGASLVPLIVGRTQQGPGPTPIENLGPSLKYGMSPLFALRSGPYLYVRAPRPELYDAEQDPREQDEASARLPRVVSALEQELQARLPGAPTDLSALRDPKDGLDLFSRYRAAQEMEGRGQGQAAIIIYRSILSESPDFTFARRRLSECLARENQLLEGDLVLKELIDRGEADESTYLNIALVRYKLRKADQALEWLHRGTQALPLSAALHHRTGRILLEVRRYEEAAGELRRAIDLEPRFTDAHLALGKALEALGRRGEAMAAYQKVAEIGPLSPEAREAAETLVHLARSR
jgi:arylsulfatase A-like enzyme